jgi:hypothetical protein
MSNGSFYGEKEKLEFDLATKGRANMRNGFIVGYQYYLKRASIKCGFCDSESCALCNLLEIDLSAILCLDRLDIMSDCWLKSRKEIS